MGKFFEILGWGSMYIFAALAASALLSGKSEKSIAELKINSLTKTNVELFVQDMAAIISGQKDNFDSFETANFLSKHISDEGAFKTIVRMTSRYAEQEREKDLEMDKKKYITHIVNSLENTENYTANTKIEYIEILDNGKRASVVTSSIEEGDYKQGDNQDTIPVSANSYCEQEYILHEEKQTIKLNKSNCTSNVEVLH